MDYNTIIENIVSFFEEFQIAAVIGVVGMLLLLWKSPKYFFIVVAIGLGGYGVIRLLQKLAAMTGLGG
jgi:hypothetical protein